MTILIPPNDIQFIDSAVSFAAINDFSEANGIYPTSYGNAKITESVMQLLHLREDADEEMQVQALTTNICIVYDLDETLIQVVQNADLERKNSSSVSDSASTTTYELQSVPNSTSESICFRESVESLREHFKQLVDMGVVFGFWTFGSPGHARRVMEIFTKNNILNAAGEVQPVFIISHDHNNTVFITKSCKKDLALLTNKIFKHWTYILIDNDEGHYNYNVARGRCVKVIKPLVCMADACLKHRALFYTRDNTIRHDDKFTNLNEVIRLIEELQQTNSLPVDCIKDKALYHYNIRSYEYTIHNHLQQYYIDKIITSIINTRITDYSNIYYNSCHETAMKKVDALYDKYKTYFKQLPDTIVWNNKEQQKYMEWLYGIVKHMKDGIMYILHIPAQDINTIYNELNSAINNYSLQTGNRIKDALVLDMLRTAKLDIGQSLSEKVIKLVSNYVRITNGMVLFIYHTIFKPIFRINHAGDEKHHVVFFIVLFRNYTYNFIMTEFHNNPIYKQQIETGTDIPPPQNPTSNSDPDLTFLFSYI